MLLLIHYMKSTGKEIIYKEDSKNGHRACTDLKWAKNVSSGELFLYAGFGDGTVASFGLKNGGIFPICNLQIGSPVCTAIRIVLPFPSYLNGL